MFRGTILVMLQMELLSVMKDTKTLQQTVLNVSKNRV